MQQDSKYKMTHTHMQGPAVKAQHSDLLPISPHKIPSLTKFRSFKFNLPQLPVALRLTVCSNLTEPGLELGSILLSLVKIQPS